MTPRSDLRLDHDGIRAVLLSGEVGGVIADVAQSVAAGAVHTTSTGVSVPVKVSTYSTDRRAASVTLTHPAGLAVQAKYGTLTAAALAAGLGVKERTG